MRLPQAQSEERMIERLRGPAPEKWKPPSLVRRRTEIPRIPGFQIGGPRHPNGPWGRKSAVGPPPSEGPAQIRLGKKGLPAATFRLGRRHSMLRSSREVKHDVIAFPHRIWPRS